MTTRSIPFGTARLHRHLEGLSELPRPREWDDRLAARLTAVPVPRPPAKMAETLCAFVHHRRMVRRIAWLSAVAASIVVVVALIVANLPK